MHFTSRKPSVDFVQGAINSDLSFQQKLEQKIPVNCLLEGRDVFAVIPTGLGKSVVLVICLVIGLIEDQTKDGQPLGLTCASLQDVNDLFGANPNGHNFCLHQQRRHLIVTLGTAKTDLQSFPNKLN